MTRIISRKGFVMAVAFLCACGKPSSVSRGWNLERAQDYAQPFSYDDVQSMLDRPCETLDLPPPSRQEIERDLVLSISSPPDLPAGGRLPILVTLANRSTNRSHRIVLPSDGYEVGMSYPHVYCSGEYLGSEGKWTEVKARQILRCGNINGNWTDYVFEIKPGEIIPLRNWTADHTRWVQFWEGGRARLTVHYVFGGWREGNGRLGREMPSGPMKGIAGFELSSSVEFEVHPPPLRLTLAVKPQLEGFKNLRFSEIFEARLVNCSAQPIVLQAPGVRGSQILFEGLHSLYRSAQPPENTSLGPGEELNLFREDPFAGAFSEMTISVDQVVRPTYMVFEGAYVDAKGRRGSIRSNNVVVQASR